MDGGEQRGEGEGREEGGCVTATRSEEERKGTHDDNPAVNANGTVKPSEKPMMVSWTISPMLECSSLCTGAGAGGRDISEEGVLEAESSMPSFLLPLLGCAEQVGLVKRVLR